MIPPEIQDQLEKEFPNFTIVDATGDIELPPEIQKMKDEIKEANDKSLFNGTCIDCEKKMPNFEIDFDDDWQPAPGWTWYEKDGAPVCWQCPECDAKESGAK